MEYGRLFAHTWRLVREHKLLWLLGLVAGLGSSGSGPARLLVGVAYPGTLPGWGDLLSADSASLSLFWPDTAAMAQAAALFFGALLLWLLTTTAEGALIAAVLQAESDERPTMRRAVTQGWRWLGRFIAIDTLLFFPLFLLVLLALLALTGALLVAGLMAAQNRTLSFITMPLLLGAACLLPLFCLLPPLTAGTLLWRTLAFRHTAVCGQGVRATIRHSWQLIRRQAMPVFIFAILLGGGRYLLALGLSALITLFIPLLTTNRTLGVPLAAALGSFTLATHAAAHTFTASAWTVLYRDLAPATFSGEERCV
jgi:hypothetical protein